MVLDSPLLVLCQSLVGLLGLLLLDLEKSSVRVDVSHFVVVEVNLVDIGTKRAQEALGWCSQTLYILNSWCWLPLHFKNYRAIDSLSITYRLNNLKISNTLVVSISHRF